MGEILRSEEQKKERRKQERKQREETKKDTRTEMFNSPIGWLTGKGNAFDWLRAARFHFLLVATASLGLACHSKGYFLHSIPGVFTIGLSKNEKSSRMHLATYA